MRQLPRGSKNASSCVAAILSGRPGGRFAPLIAAATSRLNRRGSYPASIKAIAVAPRLVRVYFGCFPPVEKELEITQAVAQRQKNGFTIRLNE